MAIEPRKTSDDERREKKICNVQSSDRLAVVGAMMVFIGAMIFCPFSHLAVWSFVIGPIIIIHYLHVYDA